MGDVDPFLVVLAAILAIGSVGGYLFTHLNIPDAIWLIAAGIVLDPVLGFLRQGTLTSIAPFFGALTIIVVRFEGGSVVVCAAVVTTILVCAVALPITRRGISAESPELPAESTVVAAAETR